MIANCQGPVNEPLDSRSLASASGDDPLGDQRFALRRRGRERDAGLQQPQAARAGGGRRQDVHERLAALDPVAQANQHFNADAVVDRLAQVLAAAAHLDHRQAQSLGVHCHDVAGLA